MQYWSPFILRIILHCHTQPTERFAQYNAPIFEKTISSLVDKGLVAPMDGGYETYETTEKGKAFVQMLLSTPSPVERYMDPRFD